MIEVIRNTYDTLEILLSAGCVLSLFSIFLGGVFSHVERLVGWLFIINLVYWFLLAMATIIAMIAEVWMT